MKDYMYMKNNRIAKNFIQRILKRALTALLIIALLFPYFSGLMPANKTYAARILRLATCKSIAANVSEKVEALELQIEAKQAAKVSAVRAIREKEKNMSTFRWSPLLNFEFPTKPNEAEAFEFAYKPVQLEYDIKTLQHKITDAKLAEYEKVSNIYIDIITSTMEINFLEERIASMEVAIKKNRARLAEGTATQAQIDQQTDKKKGFEKSLASEKTKLQRAKEKLGRELDFDVTQGYDFEEAFISANMSRDNVSYLKYYAMGAEDTSAGDIKDETVFEAKQAEELARLALVTNYNLMKSQYSGNIGMISGYVQQALDGSKINKRAFKKDYDDFLKKIDDPWTGKKKILFFSFPKVWWKGAIDGIRYIEDDPYVLYSAALEYESALKDYKNARTELGNAITDGYDNYIETRKAYLTAKDELETLQNQLIYDEALNALGQLSFEEYEGELTEYENARTALKDALSLYSSTLYQYDRTTCGGASSFFVEESISTQVGNAGLGTPDEDTGDIDDDLSKLNIIVEKGAIYSIRPIVDGEEFMLYIDIPDNFEYNITDFELWSDNRQIGKRTAKGEAIRHLTITVEEVDSVFIRLYDGDDFIDDCYIDPEVSVGPLNIKKASLPDEVDDSKVVGSYTVEEDTNTDMIRLRFTFDTRAVEKNFALGSVVKYYNLSVEQNLFLFSNDLVAQDQPFSYMSFIKNDLGKLTIRMFGEDGSYIGGADLDQTTLKLIANAEVTEADMQELAAREIVKKRKAAELQAERDRLQDMYNAAADANGLEGDGATMAYYKERLAELDEKIKAVGDSVTDEEIQKAMKDDAAEIAALVDKMNREASSEEAIVAGLTPAEIAARNTILENAAGKVVREKKKQEWLDGLDKSIRDKETELAKALAAANGQHAAGYDKEKEKAEIEALQKEIDLIKAQKDAVNAGESAISKDEISQALLEYGDEIYAAAADQLSDAMLYGSETGQWAIAYLESQGLEANNSNMRYVVENADKIRGYETLQDRKAGLEKEIEEVKAKIESLFNAQTSNTTDENLKKQLENMLKAYEGEVKKVNRELLKYDPAKEVKLKAAKDELEILKAKKSADETARAGLLAMQYNDKDDYLKPYRDEAEKRAGELNAVKSSITIWGEKRKEELGNEIERLRALLKDKEQFEKYEEELAGLNVDLQTTRGRIEHYENEAAAIMTLIENAEDEFQKYLLQHDLDKYTNSVIGYKVYEKQLEEKIDQLQKTMDKIETSSTAELKKQLREEEDELAEIPRIIRTKIAEMQEPYNQAVAELNKIEGEWDLSAKEKEIYDNNIAAYDKRIMELEALLAQYY